jgi:predicted HD phosphohydrolase
VTDPISDVDTLFAVLEAGARQTDAENVDLLAHGLQCAALLAETAPADRELQVAGLVHDIGTVLSPGRPRTHARTGSAAVAPLLGERVAWLVAHHDQAKRYLVTVEPDYRERLSRGSVRTLDAQGGLLSDDERARLESESWLDDVVTLRRGDDAAKVPGRAVPGLDHWRPVVQLLASTSHVRGG